jgi:hypothetical protein
MESVNSTEWGLELISIARCRELLDDEAESMTDEEVDDIRRNAEAMAYIVLEMFEQQCRPGE